MRRIQRGSCSLLLIHMPSLEVYLFISYAVSGGLLDAKVNHVMPCFSIIWKNKGSLLTMHLILNLSLNLIETDVGKFISIQSHIDFLPIKFYNISKYIFF